MVCAWIGRCGVQNRWTTSPRLDPDLQESADLLPLLTPYPASEMIAHPVSPRVNSPANDDADCIEPVEPDIGSLFE